MAQSAKEQSIVAMASRLRTNGFEPVPIVRGAKRPTVAKWQQGGIRDSAWGPDDGIGIVCGHGDLVAVDVDTDDPDVLRAVAEALPPDCPRKRGSKGLTFFLRAKNERKHRIPVGLAFEQGNCTVLHVEVLGKGQQTVIPPSLHPRTGSPYSWTAGSDGQVRSLYDVPVGQIPTVNEDVVQLLDKALKTHVLHPLLVAACKKIAAAPSGTRNDTLNREVFALATSRVDLWKATAKKWVMQAGLHAGLTDTEINSTFHSAADAGTAQPAKTKPSLSFTLFRDIELQPRKVWLVRDWLGAGELSCLFGQPGKGKSTIAIDLAYHVAVGDDWFGKRIQQCGVLYVAAERPDVVKRRLAALRKRHDIHAVPLAVVNGPVDLRNNDDHAREIIGHSEELADLTGCPPGLIVIETVNRVLAGGDENSSVDMGKLIHMLGLIQNTTGAHVMVVHHAPIDGGRLRGHSSLLGAVDTTIEVRKSGMNYTARIDKSNDGPSVEPIGWTVESVDLHEDLETGAITTAPIVIPKLSSPSIDKPSINKSEVEMVRILLEAGPAGLSKDDLYSKMKKSGFGGKRAATLSEAKKSLEQRNLIVEEDGVWRANLTAAQRQKYFGVE